MQVERFGNIIWKLQQRRRRDGDGNEHGKKAVDLFSFCVLFSIFRHRDFLQGDFPLVINKLIMYVYACGCTCKVLVGKQNIKAKELYWFRK